MALFVRIGVEKVFFYCSYVKTRDFYLLFFLEKKKLSFFCVGYFMR